MDDDTPKYVKAKPDQIIVGDVNEFKTIMIQPQRCIVDGHAHIENGSCVPLPLLWNQLPLGNWSQLERGTINFWGTTLMWRAGPLQVLSTTEIGSRAVEELDDMFKSKNITNSDLYKETDLFSLIVVMMMDMEYAGLMGFDVTIDGHTIDGHTIYHEDEMPWYVYLRKNAKDKENEGEKTPVPSEKIKTFSKWEQQYVETRDAMLLNPLRLIPMYHYEPRRWNKEAGTPVDFDFQHGPWNYPFKEIATPNRSAAFIGFKMYTSLGYKPLDGRLPYIQDFYARCANEGIPILNHCSPPGGGMITHEMEFYKEADDFNNQDVNAKTYFSQNYVHPTAWEKVLDKSPNLKLCLAHFGGPLWEKDDKKVDPEGNWRDEILRLINKYDNVYTDISCWNLGSCNKEDFKKKLVQNPKLKERIIFGTDWYMTLIPDYVVGPGTSYSSFCEGFWDFFIEDKKFQEGKELWQRFTFINPFKFYGLNNLATVNKIASFLEKDLENEELEKLNSNLRSFHRLIKDFDKICKKIENGG
jgi:predicted TIM-barrel fold metal-dependent hydrolase